MRVPEIGSKHFDKHQPETYPKPGQSRLTALGCTYFK